MTTTTPGDFEIGRSVLTGYTADNELNRSLTILRNEGVNPEVVVEFTAERASVLCGINEVKKLLDRVLPETGREVWALDEGVAVNTGEVEITEKQIACGHKFLNCVILALSISPKNI